MKRNLGETKLRKKHRASNPMSEFDRMPKTLRDWLNTAALPWRPVSVHRAYQKALMKTGDQQSALEYLNFLQRERLLRDRNL